MTNFPIANVRNPFRLCFKIVAGISAGVAGLYLIGGLAAIVYVGRNSPEVQQSITEVSSPVLRAALSWVF